MVDRAETILKGKNGIWDRWEIGEVEVSQNDTITLDNFSTVQQLLEAYVFKKVTGVEVTCTHATGNNVITVTGAGTNMPCFYVAYGYKA